MSEGYGTHADYMRAAAGAAESRAPVIDAALRSAFRPYLERSETDVIVFGRMTVADLADAILGNPAVLKPLIASCNIAARAIERDIGIRNVDTYAPVLVREQALAVAGYIKPFLPHALAVPALTHLDRVAFIDKEIRAAKGRWEKLVCQALSKYGRHDFHKRHFMLDGEEFELDAASPVRGTIQIGVDVKRIEARRDIHKRADEIANKAVKLKAALPQAKFAAVIYYPFLDEHGNIRSRLGKGDVDAIAFASESSLSVENAVRLLLAQLDYVGNEDALPFS